jgi:hypothetical protein
VRQAAAAVDVCPGCTQLASRLEALERRLAALEAARHTPHDRALLAQLATSTGGRWFRASDLLAHAAEDPALGAALATAWLESPRELGAWLRDRAGTADGIALARDGRGWRCMWAT